MSQPRSNGGLALGTTGTSLIFLATILVLVIYLTITRADRTEIRKPHATLTPAEATSG